MTEKNRDHVIDQERTGSLKTQCSRMPRNIGLKTKSLSAIDFSVFPNSYFFGALNIACSRKFIFRLGNRYENTKKT